MTWVSTHRKQQCYDGQLLSAEIFTREKQLITLPGWDKPIEAFLKRVCTLIARTALFECEPLHISEFSACRTARPMSDLGKKGRSDPAQPTSAPPR